MYDADCNDNGGDHAANDDDDDNNNDDTNNDNPLQLHSFSNTTATIFIIYNSNNKSFQHKQRAPKGPVLSRSQVANALALPRGQAFAPKMPPNSCASPNSIMV